MTAVAFVLILIALTVLRFLQYRDVIDPKSGFFAHDGGWLTAAYYAGVAVAAVVLLALAIVDIRRGSGILSNVEKSPKKNAKQEITDVLSEIMTDAVVGVKKVLPQRAWNSRISLPVAIIGTILTGFCGFGLAMRFAAASGNATALQLALLAMAALGFTYAAYSFLAYRRLVPTVALAFLFIAGFSAAESAFEFMQRSYTSNISARLILLSVNLLFAVFMLSAGRVIVRSETRFTSYSATISGYLAAGVIMSDFAARLLFYFTAESELQETILDFAAISGFELPNPQFIVQGLLVLWVMYALSARAKHMNTEVKAIEESTEESPQSGGSDSDSAAAVND
jgi:hypothetical protein